MTIPPLLVFACILGAALLIGIAFHAIATNRRRLGALETWRDEFDQVNAVRMRAKNKALKALE